VRIAAAWAEAAALGAMFGAVQIERVTPSATSQAAAVRAVEKV